jgi:mannose/fructose-specific phosphotransferase system component IIA
MKNDKDKNTKTVEVEAFATERMVLEMDAKHSEPPAELGGMVITELSGGSVSRAADEINLRTVYSLHETDDTNPQ